MMLKKSCDNCTKEFEYSDSRRKNARFCSLSCLSKLTKKEQDERRRIEWESETREQYLAALSKKFNKFVVKKDGCWDWNATKNKQGYGSMLHRHKLMKSHRASYLIHKGEIPKGIFVLHSCDNSSCSNPEHLFLGTNTDNMRDMTKKGRNKPRATLTPDQVIEIRNLIGLGVSNTRIAKQFGVSDVAIHYIKSNKSWKNIP